MQTKKLIKQFKKKATRSSADVVMSVREKNTADRAGLKEASNAKSNKDFEKLAENRKVRQKKVAEASAKAHDSQGKLIGVKSVVMGRKSTKSPAKAATMVPKATKSMAKRISKSSIARGGGGVSSAQLKGRKSL
jgi:hypothetical protein